MNSSIYRILSVVLLVALLGFAFWHFSRTPAIPVTLHKVTRGMVEKTVSNTRVGTVKACRRSLLAPAIGGEVAILNVMEGDEVSEGNILLEIWNNDLKSELLLARAGKKTAGEQLKQACAMAAGADRELKRLQGLSEDKLISEEKLDLAFTDAEAKRANCNRTKAEIGVSDAQIDLINTQLERTIVRAPFDGTVAEVNAELGEYVTPSPPGILTLPVIDLLDLNCLYVSAPIDEVDAPPISKGMPACVSLDAFPDKICQGYVRRIAPYVMDREKQARTVEVEVEIKDPADMQGLLPGYSADIEISLEKKTDVIRIPSEAVLEGHRVLVYDEQSGILEGRDIEVGISNWEYTEVLSGLGEGERLVLSVGREGVKHGASVTGEE